jgi:hypothetical protein
MIRGILKLAFVLSICACIGVALLWATSFRFPLSIKTTRHGERWEIVSRGGQVWMDDEPRRQDELARLPLRRQQADALLLKIDQLRPRAMEVYRRVHETKPIDPESAKEIRQIQLDKNALLARLAALGYAPVLWEGPFPTHVDDPAFVDDIYVLRDSAGQPSFWKKPTVPPTASTRRFSYLFVQGLSAGSFALAALPWIVLAFRRRSRIYSKRCAKCGYDLRASNDRCPECGMRIRVGT